MSSIKALVVSVLGTEEISREEDGKSRYSQAGDGTAEREGGREGGKEN